MLIFSTLFVQLHPYTESCLSLLPLLPCNISSTHLRDRLVIRDLCSWKMMLNKPEKSLSDAKNLILTYFISMFKMENWSKIGWDR